MSSEGINKLTCFEQRRIFKKEKELLKKYFELVYDDLVKKENENELTKLIFCSYLNFPSIISENLFRVISKSSEDKISLEDFVVGLSDMMTEDIEKIIKFIFMIADFEGKGEVCVQDFKNILRFIDSFYTSKSSESLESQFNMLFETSDSYFLPRIVENDFVSIVKKNDNFLQNLIEMLMQGFPLTTSSILILKNDYVIRETKLLYNILDNLSERNSKSFSENVSEILKEKTK
jgi:Ca2+-binding EF-hand superfamily protein